MGRVRLNAIMHTYLSTVSKVNMTRYRVGAYICAFININASQLHISFVILEGMLCIKYALPKNRIFFFFFFAGESSTGGLISSCVSHGTAGQVRWSSRQGTEKRWCGQLLESCVPHPSLEMSTLFCFTERGTGRSNKGRQTYPFMGARLFCLALRW